MSEWIDCPKCGYSHENMCACPEPMVQQPEEEMDAPQYNKDRLFHEMVEVLCGWRAALSDCELSPLEQERMNETHRLLRDTKLYEPTVAQAKQWEAERFKESAWSTSEKQGI